MSFGSALKAIATRFTFTMDGGKLAAINTAAAKTTANFGGAAKKASGLQDQLDGLFGKVKMLAGALVGGLGIKSVTVDFADWAEESGRTAESLGTSVEFLTGMQHALETVGIAGDETNQVIADISERMFDASEGSKALRDDFGLIGITGEQLKKAAKEGPEAQIMLLADAFKEAGAGAKATFVAMSGIEGTMGRKMLPLLQQGSAGLKKLFKDAERLGVVLDKKAVAEAKRFNKQMRMLKARSRGARNAIAMKLLPAVNDMIAAFGVWVGEGNNATKMLWLMAAAATAAGIAIAAMVAPRILAMFRAFQFRLGRILLLLKSITLQAALARLKLMAMVAGIIFIALVIEDLLNFVRGDKSVTEQLFGRSQVVIDGLLMIRDTFMDMLTQLEGSWTELWGAIGKLAAVFGIKLESFADLLRIIGKILFMFVVAALIVVGNILTGILWIVGKIIQAIAWLTRKIAEGLTTALKEVKNAFLDFGDTIAGVFIAIGKAAKWVGEKIGWFFSKAADLAKKAWSGLINFLKRQINRLLKLVRMAKEALGFGKTTIGGLAPTPNATATPGGGKGGTTNNVANVGEVTVVAAPGQNPREVATEVRKQVFKEMNSAWRDIVGTGGPARGAPDPSQRNPTTRRLLGQD